MRAEQEKWTKRKGEDKEKQTETKGRMRERKNNQRKQR